jgi:hypothetical protein
MYLDTRWAIQSRSWIPIRKGRLWFHLILKISNNSFTLDDLHPKDLRWRYMLDLVQEGYTEDEIASICGVTSSYVRRSFPEVAKGLSWKDTRCTGYRSGPMSAGILQFTSHFHHQSGTCELNLRGLNSSLLKFIWPPKSHFLIIHKIIVYCIQSWYLSTLFLWNYNIACWIVSNWRNPDIGSRTIVKCKRNNLAI